MHRVEFEDSYDLYPCKDNGSGPIRDFRHSHLHTNTNG